MTDKNLPDEPSSTQFLSRRERREYERAQEYARRVSDIQRAARSSESIKYDAHQSPASDEAAGSQESSRHAESGSQYDGAEAGRYATGQNLDLGDLHPLPEDTRDYPDLVPEGASHTPDEASEDDEHEKLLGYLLVADGSERTPEIDEEALKQRKTRKRRRTVVMLTSFAVFLGLLVIVGLGVSRLVGWTENDYAGPGGEEVQFEVNPGEGAIVIGNRLVEQDIVASTNAFRDAVEASDSSSQIQPGEYTLRSQMPARDAASILLREDAEGMHYVFVNSGHRIDDVYETIAEQTDYSTSDIESAADPADFGLPEDAPSLEGYIAVGEYQFPVGSSVEEILGRMIEPTMEEFERLEIDDPEEQFRVVTIASILEAEARSEDFGEVAGIIENRLDRSNPETGGYLQIDATVIYGMGVRQLQFSAEDRQDESNEYNTYAHQGLPPGPIGAPSIEALDAAAEPQDSDYYYWITTNIETGETKFSKTYEQHQEYQEEYREYCDDNPEICGRG